MPTRKLVIDIVEITKAEYDKALADVAHVQDAREDGFLRHEADMGLYALYVKKGNKFYYGGTRGFDWQNWKNMTLDDVEYDPIAIFTEEYEEKVENKPAWKPGEPKPDEGTPAQNIERMKSPRKKQAARKRA
jgi:hypothetical protein